MPGNLTEVHIPKQDGGERTLHIPPVRDRIVARSVLTAVTPFVDPHLGCASYAYRPGLGVADAVAELARLRDEGLPWVLRTDVDDCFPNVRGERALRKLFALVPDSRLNELLGQFIGRTTRTKTGRQVRPPGVPQGCPLSPLLSNIELLHLDQEIQDAGFAVVRYADDITVAAPSREDAWEAARVAAQAAEDVGMSTGADKTHVTSFEDGFTFLGEDFGPRYPVAADVARVEEPRRKILYVGLQGSRTSIRGGRILVETRHDQKVLDVPSSLVSRVVTFGSVGVSAGLRAFAMFNGVDLVFASRRGNYQGQAIAGNGRRRVDRLRAQLDAQGTPVARELARAVVQAKVLKQLVVLRRFGRRDHTENTQDSVHSMKQLLVMLPDASTVEEVMGIEGACAAAYFRAYGSLFPEGLQFTHRTRRPPLDVTNAAMSFLYTVLLGECVTALVAAGLEPCAGMFHADHGTRPSLALDLMEEFRPLIVDQVVLTVCRSRILLPHHGRAEESGPGVLLTRAGREKVLDAYERRMLQPTAGALADFSGTIRRHLYRQAQRLGATIWHGTPWTGLAWR